MESGRKSALSPEEGRRGGADEGNGGGSVGVVACTMQPADDTDVTDRYCYFIARKSWPRSAHPAHRRARAWTGSSVSFNGRLHGPMSHSVFPLLLSFSLDVFPRGNELPFRRPPTRGKNFRRIFLDKERRNASLDFNSRSLRREGC